MTLPRLVAPITFLLILVFGWLAVAQQPVPHHPYLVVDTLDKIHFTLLLESQRSDAACELQVANIGTALITTCPTCKVTTQACLTTLSEPQKKILSEAALPFPSVRTPTGVVIYHSPNPDIAIAICRLSAQTHSKNVQIPVTCSAAETVRPKPLAKKTISMQEALSILAALLSATAAAWFVCFLIIKYEHLHAHLSHDQTEGGPQKFHATPTPRIGGIGVVAGLLAAGGMMLAINPGQSTQELGALLLASAPAFVGGLTEDITKKFGIKERLLLTMLSGACGAWLMGAIVSRVDILGVDVAFQRLPFAVAFTIFAVSGICNAMNIIDGFNGLAGGVAAIMLIAIMAIAAMYNDYLVLTLALALMGALLGFLVWNWPHGRIFLGDGGAYTLGFLLAELLILLLARHPEISPWFPLAILIYPVFETLVSIYRRKLLRGRSPGHPDALHLHQLIYSRLIRGNTTSRIPVPKLIRNRKVAPYIWVVIVIVSILSVAAHSNSTFLALICGGFCATYLWVYKRILQLHTPKWLIQFQKTPRNHI